MAQGREQTGLMKTLITRVSELLNTLGNIGRDVAEPRYEEVTI